MRSRTAGRPPRPKPPPRGAAAAAEMQQPVTDESGLPGSRMLLSCGRTRRSLAAPAPCAAPIYAATAGAAAAPTGSGGGRRAALLASRAAAASRTRLRRAAMAEPEPGPRRHRPFCNRRPARHVGRAAPGSSVDVHFRTPRPARASKGGSEACGRIWRVGRSAHQRGGAPLRRVGGAWACACYVIFIKRGRENLP